MPTLDHTAAGWQGQQTIWRVGAQQFRAPLGELVRDFAGIVVIEFAKNWGFFIFRALLSEYPGGGSKLRTWPVSAESAISPFFYIFLPWKCVHLDFCFFLCCLTNLCSVLRWCNAYHARTDLMTSVVKCLSPVLLFTVVHRIGLP